MSVVTEPLTTLPLLRVDTSTAVIILQCRNTLLVFNINTRPKFTLSTKLIVASYKIDNLSCFSQVNISQYVATNKKWNCLDVKRHQFYLTLNLHPLSLRLQIATWRYELIYSRESRVDVWLIFWRSPQNPFGRSSSKFMFAHVALYIDTWRKWASVLFKTKLRYFLA